MTVKPLLDIFRDYLSLRSEDIAAAFLSGIDWNMPERSLLPHDLPGTRHLDAVLQQAGPGERRLVQAILDQRQHLHWGQTYTAEDFGADFVANYGWVEMFGTRGHFANDHMAGGFVLFGPGLDYPQHWHVAEELYIPLTGGSLWSRDEGPYLLRGSGELVFHESNEHHGMKMSEAPLLALYLWRGGDLAQKSNY